METRRLTPGPLEGGVYEICDEVMLGGSVSDYDGDLLTYEWREGTNVLSSGTVQALAEGTPVEMSACSATHLGLGVHTIILQVCDGINDPVSSSITVEVVDTTVPVLAPTVNKTILWPPNHGMVDIVIEANAGDNSGLPVALSAVVVSNEPEEGLGDGDLAIDWAEPAIDQVTGIIALQLRAERSGRGNGREYTIAITATDGAGNSSTADVNVIVPHDKGKK